MKTSILRIAVFSLLATAVALAPTQGFAQEKKKDSTSENKDAPKGEKKKRDGLPFGGKVTAIDKTAKTVTVGEKVFHVTSETRINKGGKPATLDDGVVGEDAGIYYKKEDGDKLTALSVRFGPRPDGASKTDKKKKD